jgi:hypothetical protein
MATNKIIKYDLETRATDLRGMGKTFEEIAAILSKDSKNKITLSTVFRFFESNDKATAIAIEKNKKLSTKVAEVEISTIEDRQKIISGLLSLASGALEDRDRVAAYKVATDAIDSLDKRIGKLTNNNGVTINNINAMKLSDFSTADLLRMIDVTDR